MLLLFSSTHSHASIPQFYKFFYNSPVVYSLQPSSSRLPASALHLNITCHHLLFYRHPVHPPPSILNTLSLSVLDALFPLFRSAHPGTCSVLKTLSYRSQLPASTLLFSTLSQRLLQSFSYICIYVLPHVLRQQPSGAVDNLPPLITRF